MAAPKINYERAARVVVDAISFGDRTAAKKHDVSVKTIERYRARLLTDEKLSDLVASKGREAEHGWHFARARFLRRSLQKLEKLVQQAGLSELETVIDAVSQIGQLEIALESLGGAHHQHRSEAEEDAGSGARSDESDEAEGEDRDGSSDGSPSRPDGMG